MFNKIISNPKFWKSVASLGTAFIFVFVLLFWGVNGFKTQFFEDRDPVVFIGGAIVSGFVYGFFVTYGKFWGRYKKDNL